MTKRFPRDTPRIFLVRDSQRGDSGDPQRVESGEFFFQLFEIHSFSIKTLIYYHANVE